MEQGFILNRHQFQTIVHYIVWGTIGNGGTGERTYSIFIIFSSCHPQIWFWEIWLWPSTVTLMVALEEKLLDHKRQRECRDKGIKHKCFGFNLPALHTHCSGCGSGHGCWTARELMGSRVFFPAPPRRPDPETPEGSLRPCHFLFVSFLHWLPTRLLLHGLMLVTHRTPCRALSSAPGRHAPSTNTYRTHPFVTRWHSEHVPCNSVIWCTITKLPVRTTCTLLWK